MNIKYFAWIKDITNKDDEMINEDHPKNIDELKIILCRIYPELEKYIKSADQRGGAEYVYLYNMKDRKWYFADTYKDKDIKKLF